MMMMMVSSSIVLSCRAACFALTTTMITAAIRSTKSISRHAWDRRMFPFFFLVVLSSIWSVRFELVRLLLSSSTLFLQAIFSFLSLSFFFPDLFFLVLDHSNDALEHGTGSMSHFQWIYHLIKWFTMKIVSARWQRRNREDLPRRILAV